MTTLAMTDKSCSVIVARCRLYTFLGAVLRYPDLDLVEALRHKNSWDSLGRAASSLSLEYSPPLETLAFREVGKSVEELSQTYLKVFGASPRGRVTPYECEYGNKEVFQLAGELSDISAFYHAFGMQAGGQARERIDHIAAECEFMALLCARELTSVLDHEPVEMLSGIRDAQKKFLREHLGQWGVAFAHQLRAADSEGVYGAVASLLEAVLINDCILLNVPRGSAYLPLRDVPQADDPGNCMSCGKAEGVPGADQESLPCGSNLTDG